MPPAKQLKKFESRLPVLKTGVFKKRHPVPTVTIEHASVSSLENLSLNDTLARGPLKSDLSKRLQGVVKTNHKNKENTVASTNVRDQTSAKSQGPVRRNSRLNAVSQKKKSIAKTKSILKQQNDAGVNFQSDEKALKSIITNRGIDCSNLDMQRPSMYRSYKSCRIGEKRPGAAFIDSWKPFENPYEGKSSPAVNNDHTPALLRGTIRNRQSMYYTKSPRFKTYLNNLLKQNASPIDLKPHIPQQSHDTCSKIPKDKQEVPGVASKCCESACSSYSLCRRTSADLEQFYSQQSEAYLIDELNYINKQRMIVEKCLSAKAQIYPSNDCKDDAISCLNRICELSENESPLFNEPAKQEVGFGKKVAVEQLVPSTLSRDRIDIRTPRPRHSNILEPGPFSDFSPQTPPSSNARSIVAPLPTPLVLRSMAKNAERRGLPLFSSPQEEKQHPIGSLIARENELPSRSFCDETRTSRVRVSPELDYDEHCFFGSPILNKKYRDEITDRLLVVNHFFDKFDRKFNFLCDDEVARLSDIGGKRCGFLPDKKRIRGRTVQAKTSTEAISDTKSLVYEAVSTVNTPVTPIFGARSNKYIFDSEWTVLEPRLLEPVANTLMNGDDTLFIPIAGHSEFGNDNDNQNDLFRVDE